jgi:hypothetical protein
LRGAAGGDIENALAGTSAVAEGEFVGPGQGVGGGNNVGKREDGVIGVGGLLLEYV